MSRQSLSECPAYRFPPTPHKSGRCSSGWYHGARRAALAGKPPSAAACFIKPEVNPFLTPHTRVCLSGIASSVLPLLSVTYAKSTSHFPRGKSRVLMINRPVPRYLHRSTDFWLCVPRSVAGGKICRRRDCCCVRRNASFAVSREPKVHFPSAR